MIAVDPLDLKTDNMVNRTSDFTQSVEGQIGNHLQPIYDLVDSDRIHFPSFVYQPDEDD